MYISLKLVKKKTNEYKHIYMNKSKNYIVVYLFIFLLKIVFFLSLFFLVKFIDFEFGKNLEEEE